MHEYKKSYGDLLKQLLNVLINVHINDEWNFYYQKIVGR